MFTAGQAAVMENIVANRTFKANTCTAAAPTCDDGIQNQGETGIDCGGPCAACATCNDGIQNQGETDIDCGGPNCNACPCFDTPVQIVLVVDNYASETTWSVVDASGNVVGSGGPYADGQNGAVGTFDFCLTDGCYDFIINDSYGDGICCEYGNGSYTVTNLDDNSVLVSGGEFGSTETQQFCLGGGVTPTCDDGIQNQGETGVDCGGPNCSPCTTACTSPTPDAEQFEINGCGTLRLNWSDVSGATSYRIRGRKVGGANGAYRYWNNVPNNFRDFQGVVDGRSYEWSVEANCPAGPTGFFADVVITYNASAGCAGARLAGIADPFDAFAVELYPNPAQDNLTINVSSIDEKVTSDVVIYDLTGRQVLRDSRTASGQFDLDISDLTTGCYMITVTNGSETVTEKLIVQ